MASEFEELMAKYNAKCAELEEMTELADDFEVENTLLKAMLIERGVTEEMWQALMEVE